MRSTEMFDEISGPNSFRRVDETHPLDLYIGKDSMSRNTLLLISNEAPHALVSSQIILVSVGARKDSRMAISFSLANDEFADIFEHFCNDIIASSRSSDPNIAGTSFVAGRYEKWQSMLAKQNGDILSPSSIKGLIGELCFLKDFLIPQYGQDIAVQSWIGPERADQDFVCENTWYEVKSTVSGSESVRISSVEQLDTTAEGLLVVMYLDKTSTADMDRLSLNSLVLHIIESLDDEELRNKLSLTLLNLGYYHRSAYDRYSFRFSGMRLFRVNDSFPCIRRKDLASSVSSVKYELSLAAIREYEIET